ncbi:hypothetical protein BGX21_001734 [Mortierella sp. AD011]|nr:hypothetical protein BGX20_003977 [Mortierella sp. AD010]KAF9382753.1 hypothetical protein BGX21_001734 [Mortierella sp. AD011]
MYLDIFSVNGLASTSTNRSPPIAAMTITEFVISEAHYLIAIKGVANALNQVTESTLSAGHKESVAVRSLIDRWTEMMRVHAKFCDDIVSVNENFRGVAARINSLNSGHTLAEWDLALRQPFEHLAGYDEWFQRIDPQSKFCKDYRSLLSGVIHKIKVATDANPQSHNMPQRLSIMASGIVRRRSSAQTLSSSSSAPQTPTTPDTPSSVYSTDASSIPSPIVDKAVSCQSAENSSLASLPMPETVRDLAVTDHAMATDAVMEPASSSDVRNNDQKGLEEKESPAIPTTADSDMKEPSTLIADTFLTPVHPARQPQYHSSASSGLSSSHTLAIETSPSMETSSTSPVYSKSSYSAETPQGKPTASTTSSLSKQTFLAENENRKATLRVGISVAIKAKAESLQPPTYATKTTIENLRKIPPVKNVTAKKPPVKSLISFWEQVKVSSPLDA